jgi:hypothetical protein
MLLYNYDFVRVWNWIICSIRYGTYSGFWTRSNLISSLFTLCIIQNISYCFLFPTCTLWK